MGRADGFRRDPKTPLTSVESRLNDREEQKGTMENELSLIPHDDAFRVCGLSSNLGKIQMWMLERRNICTQKMHERQKKRAKANSSSLTPRFRFYLSPLILAFTPQRSTVNFRKKSVGAKVVDKVLTRQPDAGFWERRDSVIRRRMFPKKIIIS